MSARQIIERSELGIEVPERPKAPKRKITRGDLAQRAQGPFQAVKREPLIALGPVVAKINAAARRAELLPVPAEDFTFRTRQP